MNHSNAVINKEEKERELETLHRKMFTNREMLQRNLEIFHDNLERLLGGFPPHSSGAQAPGPIPVPQGMVGKLIQEADQYYDLLIQLNHQLDTLGRL